MRRLADGAWEEWRVCFPSQVGAPLDGRNGTKQLQRRLSESGLPRVTLHALRHTCATLQLEQGIPARGVMDALGHSQIALTLGTYAHAQSPLFREAADLMQRALGS